jgi:putative endonuclease
LQKPAEALFIWRTTMFSTYIIYSKSMDQYYTGYTSHPVQKRLQWHNNGSSSSTKAGIPWGIKYVKSFQTKSEAIKWENFIKRQKSRPFIERLINSKENEWK